MEACRMHSAGGMHIDYTTAVQPYEPGKNSCRADQIAYRSADPFAHRYPFAHADANADCDANTDAYTRAYAHADPDAGADPRSDGGRCGDRELSGL